MVGRMSNYPPGVTGSEPEIVGPSAMELSIRENEAAMLVLEKYVKWLNLWGKKTGSPGWQWTDLSVDNFFEYDSSWVLSDQVDLRDEWRTVCLRLDYGDDGGPAYVVARFQQFFNYVEKKYQGWILQWIIQEFDTMPQGIYGDWIGNKFGWVLDREVVPDEDERMVQ